MAAIERRHSASPYEPVVGYCRALRVGDRVLVSGTAPIGPDGANVAPDDVVAQARRCLDLIDEHLVALGGGEAIVVRTRVYLTDAADWQAVGRVHGERFRDAPPVTAFVEVSALLHPDWRVEIEAEAVVP